MKDMAIGRTDILKALKILGMEVLDWGTIRRWKRNYSMPIRYLPNGKPFIIPQEVQTWMVVFSDLKMQQAK